MIEIPDRYGGGWGGRIIISPARKRWKLDDLLEDISPANRHREVKWGQTNGKEVW